jgi:hypothetical protein
VELLEVSTNGSTVDPEALVGVLQTVVINLKTSKITLMKFSSDYSGLQYPAALLQGIHSLRVLHLRTALSGLDMSWINKHGDTLEELDLWQEMYVSRDCKFSCCLGVAQLGALQQSCWRLETLSVDLDLKEYDVST